MLNPESCAKLAALHLEPGKNEIQLAAEFAKIVKFSSMENQCNCNLREFYASAQHKWDRTVQRALNGLVISDVVNLIVQFSNLCNDNEQAIVDSIHQSKWTCNWMLLRAIELGPARTIIEAITKTGFQNAQQEWFWLVREFCRVHGDLGFDYFISKCSPVWRVSHHHVSISVHQLLGAINAAMEVLDKVETRCTQSYPYCACASFPQKKQKTNAEAISFGPKKA